VIALALILKDFRFEPTPGLNPWPVQKLTVQAQNGLPMRVGLSVDHARHQCAG
jgi:hypothetical protein